MPDTPTSKTGKKREKIKQKELEKGLEASFPASDPPASAQPGGNDPAPSSGYNETEEKARESKR